MPIDPVTGGLVAQGVIAASQAISRGGPRRQYKWNKRAAEDTNRMNRDNAIWALEENKKIQNEQRVYDSAEAQMARYKSAGLNPHLIYGSGASSSGGTFPISTQGIAPSRIDAPSAAYPDLAGSFLQAGQTMANTSLTQAKTEESYINQALKEIQTDIAKTNPMLNPGVYQSMIGSMSALADAKMKEAKAYWSIRENTTESSFERYTLGEKKITQEIEAMAQKLGLNNADLKIRNQIFESKDYENAIRKIQAAWLTDGDISPEHIRQGLMLFLQQMLGATFGK